MSCFLRERNTVEGMNPVKVYIMNNKKHVAKYDGEVKVSHSVFNTLHPVFQASILKRKADRERLKEEKEQKHEAPAEAPRNARSIARSESAKVIRDLVKDAKEQVRKGATTEVTNELTEKIRRKLNLHGAEYMSSGEASEVFDRIFNQISEEYYQYRRAHPEVLKREQEEVKQEKALKEKAEEVKPYDPLSELKNVVATAIEASKEGHLFKRRENWKGKAGFMKKIDKLWDKWTGSSDAFFREVPYHFNWKPKLEPEDLVSEQAKNIRRSLK